MSKIQKSIINNSKLDQVKTSNIKSSKNSYKRKKSNKDQKPKNNTVKTKSKNNASTLKDSLAGIDIPLITKTKDILEIKSAHKISLPTTLTTIKSNEYLKDVKKINNENIFSKMAIKDSAYCSNALIQDDTTSSDIIEYNSSESIINKINFDLLNKIKIIYKEMQLIFSINSNKENAYNYFKAKIYAFDYFQFLFSDEIKYIIKLFNYSLEIGEFIMTQIFLFSQILYIDEDNMIDNFQFSYKIVFLYSLQNFEFLISIISNSTILSEPKKMIMMKNKNKIIISILKSFNLNNALKNNIKNIIDNKLNLIGGFPYKFLQELLKINKTSTNVTKTLISEYNLNINANKNINSNKSIGIIHLLLLFRTNKELKSKLAQIYEKSNNFPEFYNNNSQYNFYNFIYLNNERLLKKYEKQKAESQIITELGNFSENTNFQYHLIIELDETLVHYCEEKNSYYVKLRYGYESFFRSAKNFFEIIVLSSSGKEYTNIIIDCINKDEELIQGIIYSEDFDGLDLTKINRNLNKCIFICHKNNFFNAPINNIIQLSEFNGDERDREIVFLQKEISKIQKIKNVTDVSYLIEEMKIGINHARKMNMK